MGFFSTKNGDGASAGDQSADTIPPREVARLQREAELNGCDTVTELVEAPSSRHSGYYSLWGARQN